MRTRVTAILVARSGGEWLDETLAGIAAQTRTPDRIIAVVNGGRENLAQKLRVHPGISGVVSTQNIVPFGAAVQQGIAAIPSDSQSQAGALVGAATGSAASAASEASEASAANAANPASEGAAAVAAASDITSDITSNYAVGVASSDPAQDWFWLLAEDSAPEPNALAEIVSTVQRAPSVAVAGPKLVGWDRPDRIIELGQSLTSRGDRWLLRRQERDQQQYDHLQDVLGVGPVGMLVREEVWRQLEGFDPAYTVYDDGLDLSVRARLAGFRVIVAPTSRVRFAQLGVAGPRIERSKRVMRTAHREARTAQLHRRIAYAPSIAAFFMWLGLPLLAVFRVAWALVREQPGNLWGEFSSALRVFFRPGMIIASRRRVRDANTTGWGAVKPLRIDPKSVRTARMIDREAILVSQGRLRDDLHFISSGGLAVLLASVLVTIGLTWWAVIQINLTGGSLAPLSPLPELWANTRTENGVPADPFAWVLALLGTLTFWNPSYGVVLMLIAAIPLASLGGWIWAAQLTKNSAGRALLALAWAFSPVLLGSLAAGRLPTLVLAVTLPWLLLAATRARTSWSWAGTASLLAAIALACAPVLIPAALVLLIVGMIGSPRGIARVLTIAIAPFALFVPKLLMLLRGANPIDLLQDPGITSTFVPGTTWHLLLGFPEFGLEGWGGILMQLGLGGSPATVLVGVLLLPIVLLAALGLLTGRVHFTVLHAVLGGVGLLTAVGASKLELTSIGSQEVALWTGSGLALYWMAVLGLAAVGTTALRRAATPVVMVGLVMAMVAIAPLAVVLATNQTGIGAGNTQMPALVQAAGKQDPTLRTLVLTVEGERSVRAQVVDGAGLRLDVVRTAALPSAVTAHDKQITQLVAALASTGDEVRTQEVVAAEGIGFVLLENTGDATERSQLQSAFDQQPVLENAGQTSHGLLWRVAEEGDEGADGSSAGGSGAAGAAGAAQLDADAGPSWIAGISNKLFAGLLWWAQVIVLGALFLLALPTSEVVEQPIRRRKVRPEDGVGDATAASAVPVHTAPTPGPVPAPSPGPVPASVPASVPVSETNAPDGSAEVGEVVDADAGEATTAGDAGEQATGDPRPEHATSFVDKLPKFLRPADHDTPEGGAK